MPTCKEETMSLSSRMTKMALSAFVAALFSLTSAWAQNFQITEYPIPTVGSVPNGITAGPDGNLWFTERSGSQIGRITTAGVITEFPIPTTGGQPLGIAAGPDGNLWFTEATSGKVG